MTPDTVSPEPAVLSRLRSNKKTKIALVAVYLPIVAMAVVGWLIVLGHSHIGARPAIPVISQTAHIYPSLLLLAGVCFVLGLRHAMDVDHIAAIDNVTRKLVNDGQRPVAVGFFFSFGHSVAVLAMAASLVIGERYLKKDLTQYSDRIDMIGSSVCALVLYILALMNVPVLLGVLKTYKKLDSGEMSSGEYEEELQQKGFMNRYFKWIYKSIHASWQMFPVGILFGLGFDTATEMVVLAATASAASSNTLPMPLAFVCLMLFFASMMFLDTSDSVAMQYAYRWAFSDPKRKSVYNFLMTAISMLIAFGIGSVEWLQVISTAEGLKGGVWYWLNQLDLTDLGIGSAVLFMALWVVAMLIYRKVKPSGGTPPMSMGPDRLEPGVE